MEILLENSMKNTNLVNAKLFNCLKYSKLPLNYQTLALKKLGISLSFCNKLFVALEKA